MSKTLAQIFALNPTTVINNTDLFYLVQSPYTPGTDSAITGASLKSSFGTVTSIATNNGITGGTITTTGTIGLAAIANNTLLANISGGLLFPSSTTLTSLIDSAIGSAQGDILYRNATTWTVLTPGTSGQFLQTQGAAANVQWASGNAGTVTSISAGTGITLTPSPITTTGSVALTIPVAVTNGGTGLISTTINQILYSSAANTISGLATANNGLLVTSSVGIPSILAGPGTTGNVLQSNAAASPSFSTSTYPSTATATGTILRADGTNWTPTTSTYPNTNAINTLLYASAANVMSALPTVVRASLSTNSTGVPTWLALTDGQLVIGSTAGSPAAASLSAGSGISITPGSNTITIAATGGTGTVTSISAGTGITLTPNPIVTTGTVALTTPVVLTDGGTNASLTANNGGIVWSNTTQLQILSGTATANQVLLSGSTATPAWSTATYPATTTINQILYSSAANVISGLATANSSILVTSAGGVPSLSTTLPSFTTNTITFSPTTAGIKGTTTNDNTAAGNVGEFVSSVIAAASAVSCANNTATNITSISLSAGDWDVWGNITIQAVASNTGSISGWISSSNATLPDRSLLCSIAGFVLGVTTGVCAPQQRFSLSGTTTIYLSAQQNSTSGSVTVCGGIYARRSR